MSELSSRGYKCCTGRSITWECVALPLKYTISASYHVDNYPQLPLSTVLLIGLDDNHIFFSWMVLSPLCFRWCLSRSPPQVFFGPARPHCIFILAQVPIAPLIFHYLLDPFGLTDECFAIVRVDALRSPTSGDEALQAYDELSGLKVWHKVYIHGTCKRTARCMLFFQFLVSSGTSVVPQSPLQ